MIKLLIHTFKTTLLLLFVIFQTNLSAQEEWPHNSRSWDNPLFQARVQGVYDWIGSGPDRLSEYQIYSIQDGAPQVNSVSFLRRSTENRDIDSFPPRTEVDPDAEFIAPAKDWRDREILIQTMSSNGIIDEGFFEDAITADAGPDAYYLLGNLYFLQSRLQDAVLNYNEAIQKFPRFRLAHQNLAYSHFLLGDCENALTAAATAIQLGALSARIKGVQAYCALQKGQLQTAVDAIEMARLLEPQNEEWHRLQLEALIRKGDFVEASKQLQAEFEKSGASGVRLAALANLYRANEDAAALLTVLEIINRAGLSTDSSKQELIRLKISSGVAHLVPEIELADYAKDPATTGDQLVYLLTSLDSAAGTNSAAGVSGVVIDPMGMDLTSAEKSAILVAQALALKDAGDLPQALAKVELALAAEPLFCEALILSAEIYSRTGQHALAGGMLTRMQRASLECFNANLSRQAQIYFDRGDYSQSLELLEMDNSQKSLSQIRRDRWQRTMMRELANLVQMTAQ